MSPDARLADILTTLEAVDLKALVMGGHAVRFYGLDRTTVDYDLHLAPECWDDLSVKLTQAPLFSGRTLIEGPSWRPKDFRRFQIGILPSGREEWLEFWRENHLLAPFPELFSRRELGVYGGRTIAFLSLPDLIRSKETERESDWQDVGYLEEFLDARLLARATAGQDSWVEVLSRIRSRRGFETLFKQGRLDDRALVHQALGEAKLAITQAYLLPCAPECENLLPLSVPMEPVVVSRLRTTPPGSSLHLALVEIARRQYKLAAQSADKANKEAIRAEQGRAATAPGHE